MRATFRMDMEVNYRLLGLGRLHRLWMLPHDERPYSFCPLCGGDLELRTLKTDRTANGWSACAAGSSSISTRRSRSARSSATSDDHIVLVRRAIEPGYGKWVFPGGYVDRGEQVPTAAIREAREEAGLDIRLDQLINVYSYPGRAPVIIVYAATMVGGELGVR